MPAGRSAMGANPGPPPSGVAVGRKGSTTTIAIGRGRLSRGLATLLWPTIALLVAFVGYQLDPEQGWLVGGVAALFVLMMLGLGRAVGGEGGVGSIRFTDERVWIDRPERAAPALVNALRTAVQQRGGADLADVRPVVESLPLKAVERIRVESGPSPSRNRGPVPVPRPLIEAERPVAGRDAARWHEARVDPRLLAVPLELAGLSGNDAGKT